MLSRTACGGAGSLHGLELVQSRTFCGASRNITDPQDTSLRLKSEPGATDTPHVPRPRRAHRPLPSAASLASAAGRHCREACGPGAAGRQWLMGPVCDPSSCLLSGSQLMGLTSWHHLFRRKKPPQPRCHGLHRPPGSRDAKPCSSLCTLFLFGDFKRYLPRLLL